MTLPDLESLPPESLIALEYCAPVQREQLGLALALDQRLGQLVARTSEPMLGQMRLAWWREALRQTPELRPKGDAVLDGISQIWRASCDPLIDLVDGWEHLLDEGRLDHAAAMACAEARAGAVLAATGLGLDEPGASAARAAGLIWALADLAAKVSSSDERAVVIAAGLAAPLPRRRIPPPARALAVLGALGQRSLRRGGRPLMEGRMAALIAVRAAIFMR